MGGSRLGPAVLPCQHARRLGTRGRRRGVRDGRALACLRLWPGRSSPASKRVRAAKWIWGGARGGGAGREPRGRCARIGTCAAQTPATCRGALAAAPRLPRAALGPLASAQGRRREPGARARPYFTAGSARLCRTRRDSGCARARDRGTIPSWGSPPPQYTFCLGLGFVTFPR